MKCYVLDASSIFRMSPSDLSRLDGYLYTTSLVKSEIKARISRIRFELLSERLSVLSPSSESRREVLEAVSDLREELSEADVSLLALAWDLRKSCKEVCVVTEDLWIQTAAKRLGFRTFGLRKSVSSALKLMKKCLDCGEVYDARYSECPFCGSRRSRIIKIWVKGGAQGR